MITKKKVTIEITEEDKEVRYYIIRAPKLYQGSSSGVDVERDIIKEIQEYYYNFLIFLKHWKVYHQLVVFH